MTDKTRKSLRDRIGIKFGKTSEEYKYCFFSDDRRLKSFCEIFNIN